jgi:hypothetical protein
VCASAAVQPTESSGSITNTGTPLDAPSGVASPASAVSPDSLRADLPPFKRLCSYVMMSCHITHCCVASWQGDCFASAGMRCGARAHLRGRRRQGMCADEAHWRHARRPAIQQPLQVVHGADAAQAGARHHGPRARRTLQICCWDDGPAHSNTVASGPRLLLEDAGVSYGHF